VHVKVVEAVLWSETKLYNIANRERWKKTMSGTSLVEDEERKQMHGTTTAMQKMATVQAVQAKIRQKGSRTWRGKTTGTTTIGKFVIMMLLKVAVICKLSITFNHLAGLLGMIFLERMTSKGQEIPILKDVRQKLTVTRS
jgi:hypothetical protein